MLDKKQQKKWYVKNGIDIVKIKAVQISAFKEENEEITHTKSNKNR